MELVNWLRWQWRKWETWQKWWVLACFLMGASISAGAPFNLYFQLAGIAIFFFYALKWFIVNLLWAVIVPIKNPSRICWKLLKLHTRNNIC